MGLCASMSQTSQLKLIFMQIYQKYIKNRQLLSQQNKQKGITPCSITQVGVCSSSGKPQSCTYEPGLEGLINKAGKIKQGHRDREQEKDEGTGFCCQFVALGASRQPSKGRGWTEHPKERSGGCLEQQEDRRGLKCRTGSQGEEVTWKHRKEGGKAKAERESGWQLHICADM